MKVFAKKMERRGTPIVEETYLYLRRISVSKKTLYSYGYGLRDESEVIGKKKHITYTCRAIIFRQPENPIPTAKKGNSGAEDEKAKINR